MSNYVHGGSGDSAIDEPIVPPAIEGGIAGQARNDGKGQARNAHSVIAASEPQSGLDSGDHAAMSDQNDSDVGWSGGTTGQARNAHSVIAAFEPQSGLDSSEHAAMSDQNDSDVGWSGGTTGQARNAHSVIAAFEPQSGLDSSDHAPMSDQNDSDVGWSCGTTGQARNAHSVIAASEPQSGLDSGDHAAMSDQNNSDVGWSCGTTGEGRFVPEAMPDLETAHLAIDTEIDEAGDDENGNWGELSDESVVEQLRNGEFQADHIPPANGVNPSREYELARDHEALTDRQFINQSSEETRFPPDVLAANADLISDIDDLTTQYGTHRSALLPILEGLRDRRRQINAVAMQVVADRLGISAVDVEGVVTFYHFLGRQPTGKHVIHVCRTISCALKGMEQVVQRLERETGVSMDQTTTDGSVTLEWANCIGLCDQAPAILVDRAAVGPVTPDQAANIITMLR